MQMTEREQLVELLGDFLGPEAATWHWTQSRHAWGGLSAQELWHLGCHETVRLWIYDFTGALLRGVITPP